MGAILVHSGEAVLNENKPVENTYREADSNEIPLIADQWIMLNEFDGIEK